MRIWTPCCPPPTAPAGAPARATTAQFCAPLARIVAQNIGSTQAFSVGTRLRYHHPRGSPYGPSGRARIRYRGPCRPTSDADLGPIWTSANGLNGRARM
eukprot:3512679-Pyramimonas_sp.AAC.1